MRTRMIVALLIVALAVTASVMLTAAPRRGAAGAPGVGAAVPGGPGCLWGMGPGLGRLVKELGLTEAQIADLKSIHEDFLTATKTPREGLQARAKEMVGLWTVKNPVPVAIKALAGDIDALRVQIRDAGIDHMVSALNVLTPAQREKLRTIIKNRAPQMIGMGCGLCCGPGLGCGMGMGPGGGGPGPGGMGRGMGRGMGPGWGNGTGPRSQTGTCPLLSK